MCAFVLNESDDESKYSTYGRHTVMSYHNVIPTYSMIIEQVRSFANNTGRFTGMCIFKVIGKKCLTIRVRPIIVIEAKQIEDRYGHG